MKQSQLIKLVDICSFVSLFLLVLTGTLLKFTLPIRSGPATVLSMTRHEWGDIHFYVSILFLVMMSLHLFTHLRYIKQLLGGNVSTANKYRLGVGLIGVFALLLILLSPSVSSVSDESGQRHGYGKN